MRSIKARTVEALRARRELLARLSKPLVDWKVTGTETGRIRGFRQHSTVIDQEWSRLDCGHQHTCICDVTAILDGMRD